MPTLKDVALRANVDPSTVSRVINGSTSARINPKTRSRILRIADELDYRGNFQARALRRGKTGMIGLLIPETHDPILSQYHHRIEDRLRQRKLQPFVVRIGWSPEDEAEQINILRQGMVDGLIALSAKESLIPLYDDLRSKGIALMLRVPHTNGFEDYPGCVHVDIANGFRQLADHMIGLGRRRIGILGSRVAMELNQGTTHLPATQALVAALRGHGLEPRPELSFPITQTVEDHKPMSDRIAHWLKETSGGIDGLLVVNHRELLAVWRAIRLCGLRIPEDLMLCSLGDSDLTRLWEPAITVWNLPIEKTSDALVDGLLQQINDPNQVPDLNVTHGQLLARDTTQA